jgi:hypothetical protein
VNKAEGVTFELDDEALKQAAETGTGQFKLVESGSGFGTATFQITGTLGSGPDACTITGGPESRQVEPDTGGLSISFAKWSAGGFQLPTSRDIEIGGVSTDPPEATVTCPDSDPVQVPMPFSQWMVLPASVTKIGPGGGQVSGTFPIPPLISTAIDIRAVR